MAGCPAIPRLWPLKKGVDPREQALGMTDNQTSVEIDMTDAPRPKGAFAVGTSCVPGWTRPSLSTRWQHALLAPTPPMRQFSMRTKLAVTPRSRQIREHHSMRRVARRP